MAKSSPFSQAHRGPPPLDNNDPENFGSHGFPVPHGPPPPRGSYRSEHPLPSAERGKHPHITHGDDDRAFGHIGSSTSRHIERDERVPQKLRGGPPIHTDRDGHPAFSEGITAAGQVGADRIRGRTKDIRGGSPDAHSLSLASEKHQYNE